MNTPDVAHHLGDWRADLAEGHDHPVQRVLGFALLLLALPLALRLLQPEPIWPLSEAQWLWARSAMGLVSVVVALLVFVTGYRAILSARKGAVVTLGLAFLAVAMLEFSLLMVLPGMPAIGPAQTVQRTMLLSMAARWVAALALLLFVSLPVLPQYSLKAKRLAVAGVALLSIGLAAWCIAQPGDWPVLFEPEWGLTPLKVGLEWGVIGLHVASAVVLWRRRASLVTECVMALAFAVSLSALAALLGTLQNDANRSWIVLSSQAYKLAGYLFLFHATFHEALRRPLERMAVQGLRESLVLNVAPDGVLWISETGCILMANPAMAQMSGYEASALIGQNVDIFLPPELRARHAQSMRAFFQQSDARAMGQIELKLRRADGVMVPVDISLGHWKDEQQQHAIAYVRDLRERKGFEDSLRHRATHDQLTDLPNRWLFNLQLEQALAHGRRTGHRVAVLFLDLDDFKTVNDTFGHGPGDELLIQVSQRLRQAVRESDLLARLGGDEFALLLPDVGEVAEATQVAAKLLSVLDEPFVVNGHDVLSGSSLGIAFFPDDAQDSEGLMRCADMAMYQAKRSGRGAQACYSAHLHLGAHENLQMHLRLKEAIGRGRLALHYQPQVDLRSGDIVGAEALLRWHDELLGEVSPARFIPVAESTGLILPLSDWVLVTACQQIADWARQGMALRVAVNLSAHQFRQGQLPERVRAALASSGAPAHLLEIEITESVAMMHPALAREQLEALVGMGCSVALDDFGTGYSSMAYLKALPVSTIKIDRGFIQDIPHDQSDAQISRSIIALAHGLGLSVVAEGVETEAQRSFLASHGCEVYQGWLFARAMPAAEFGVFYRNATGRQPAVP